MGDMRIYIYLYATNQQNNTYARWKEEKDNDVFEKKNINDVFEENNINDVFEEKNINDVFEEKIIYDVFQEKNKYQQEHLGTRQEDQTFLFPFVVSSMLQKGSFPFASSAKLDLENNYVEQDWEGQQDSHHGQ